MYMHGAHSHTRVHILIVACMYVHSLRVGDGLCRQVRRHFCPAPRMACGS